MRAAWIVMSTVGIAACSPGPRVDTLPAEILWVAFLHVDNGQRVVGGTPLVRVQVGEAPELPDREAESIYVVGFDSETIRALSPPDDRIVEDPLFVADPCDVPLPDPQFTAAYKNDAFEASPDVPALSTAWHAASCPTLALDQITADDTCVRGACAPPARQNGCCLRLDMRDCALDDIQLSIARDGTTTFAEAFGEAECSSATTGPPNALATFVCSEPISCRVDLYDVVPAPGLLVERAQLHEVVPRNTMPPDENALRTNVVYDGYLGDLLVYDDHLVVSTFGGEFRNHICRDEMRAKLMMIDPDTLAITARVDAPACTAHLAKDPRVTGHFVGTAGSGVRYRLITFDTEGTVTASVAIPTAALPGVDQMTINDLFVGGDPTSVFVVLAAVSENNKNVILRFTLDLTLEYTSEVLDRNLVAIRGAPPPEIFLMDDFQNELLWFDSARNLLTHRIHAGIRGANQMLNVHLHPDGQRALLPTAGDFGAVHLSEKGVTTVRAKPYLFSASVTALGPWDGDIWLAASTRHRQDDFEANVALFDTTRPRFLETQVDFGPAVVSQIGARQPREAFMLLNWSAEVARVTVRP